MNDIECIEHVMNMLDREIKENKNINMDNPTPEAVHQVERLETWTRLSRMYRLKKMVVEYG